MAMNGLEMEWDPAHTPELGLRPRLVCVREAERKEIVRAWVRVSVAGGKSAPMHWSAVTGVDSFMLPTFSKHNRFCIHAIFSLE